MSEITLYSAPLCPFAHRTRLALAEKGVQATEVEIDLHNKPAGFLEISPHGKVPVLSHAGRLVWESALINEYLDEAFPAKPCCPSEPIQRAYARIWINFADSRLYSTTGKLLHSPDQKVQALGVIQLADDLRFLESRALATKQGDGPYWLGSELSLADLAFHPWFEQVTVLERYRNFKMPADCSRLMRWWETIASRDAVRSIAKPQKFYLERNALLLRA